ncbi:SDR family NAD(P)-dependent oxidoreductase [Dapis sp. BLCC M126]|uniref:SDR family NAD(P)-dependent oxidoreductase n=1 Tax=Dapis sp. BLCC M126 TaxID=3400189 RepID=UPI003CFA7B01
MTKKKINVVILEARRQTMTKERGTVIVTGGSRGIGKATSLCLARLGYDVILTWHSSQEKADNIVSQIYEMGQKAKSFQLRLETDDIEEKFGEMTGWAKQPIVGLVNNAAIFESRTPFTEKSPEDLHQIFQVNVFSLLALCKAAFNPMAISKGGMGGSIVNLSSQVATFGGNRLLAYAASKGAVNALTLSLAREVGHEGIRVNAVSPGLIDSFEDPLLSEQFHPKISQIPLGRLGTPEDVAELIAWLISPKSSFVSGTIIPVHGAR